MKSDIGAITCARYAFAPNYYHYCGPDTNGSFGAYVSSSEADPRLEGYLAKFETLYPYLKVIAEANSITDVFDPRVVDAYWVGNSLLNRVTPQKTYTALAFDQQLEKRLSKKELQWLYPKIDQKAKLHHSFHVFNIFTRTGHNMVAHTVDTMDQCRIGWGKITNSNVKTRKSNKITVMSQRLVYINGRLQFIETRREVINPIENLRLKAGDLVSFHWGYVCEKISQQQMKNLEQLTLHHLALANQTI